MRPLKATFSTANLINNLAIIRAQAPHSKIVAMIKANAYGHGLCAVAERLQGKVEMMGVASIDEALTLRAQGIKTPVLLMEGIFSPKEINLAIQNNLHLVVHDLSQVAWLEESNLSAPIHIWLKIDTGMGRLGFLPSQFKNVYDRLLCLPSVIKPMPIMSHFACADIKDHPLNTEQMKTFYELGKGLNNPLSLCNSPALFNFPSCHHEWVRPGLSLYGLSPIPEKTTNELGLKPVMTLQSKLISVKTPPYGSTIGYAARYYHKSNGSIGIVACGYGDGYPLAVSDGAPILVNGIRCSVVGRISMDMMAVDLSPCPQAKVGDPAILWGETLCINEIVAKAQYTSERQLLTDIHQRVPTFWDDERD